VGGVWVGVFFLPPASTQTFFSIFAASLCLNIGLCIFSNFYANERSFFGPCARLAPIWLAFPRVVLCADMIFLILRSRRPSTMKLQKRQYGSSTKVSLSLLQSQHWTAGELLLSIFPLTARALFSASLSFDYSDASKQLCPPFWNWLEHQNLFAKFTQF